MGRRYKPMWAIQGDTVAMAFVLLDGSGLYPTMFVSFTALSFPGHE